MNQLTLHPRSEHPLRVPLAHHSFVEERRVGGRQQHERLVYGEACALLCMDVRERTNAKNVIRK